jgi:hypothetical protein
MFWLGDLRWFVIVIVIVIVIVVAMVIAVDIVIRIQVCGLRFRSGEIDSLNVVRGPLNGT